MDRTYLVTYKGRAPQTVTGNIIFFSGLNTEIRQPAKNTVLLNADEVISVIEQPTKN